MIDPNCAVCLGLGWVCENHPKKVRDENLGCQCGAGMPCECQRAKGLDQDNGAIPHAKRKRETSCGHNLILHD
jgi:hypothetical protein